MARKRVATKQHNGPKIVERRRLRTYKIPKALWNLDDEKLAELPKRIEEHKKLYHALLEALDEWEARNPELAKLAPWYQAREAWKAAGRPEPHWMTLLWRTDQSAEIIDPHCQETLWRFACYVKRLNLFRQGLSKDGHFQGGVFNAMNPVRQRALIRMGYWDPVQRCWTAKAYARMAADRAKKHKAKK